MPRTDSPDPVLPPTDAAVCEVLPKFGLAFFTDGKTRTWGATRCTLGPDIDVLRVRLYLVDRDGFSIVQRCELVP